MSNQVTRGPAEAAAATDGQAAAATVPTEPEGTAGGGQARHALIYVPGLANRWYNRDADDIVEQVAVALCSASVPPIPMTAAAAEPEEVTYGPGATYTASKYTIRTQSPADPAAVCDVYTLNYDKNLTGAWEESHVLVQTLVVMWRVIQGFLRLPLALARALGRNSGKGPGQVLQVGYLTAILVVISLYLIFLIAGLAPIVAGVVSDIAAAAAAPAGAQNAPSPAPAFERPSLPSFIDPHGVLVAWVAALADAVGTVISVLMIPLRWGWGLLTWLAEWLWAAVVWLGGQGRMLWETAEPLWAGIAVVVALVLAFVRKSRNAIKSAATTFVCAWNYLGDGTRRDAISGQLTAMVQHLAATGSSYEGIHILSYSFGSVAVLDALFPHDYRSSSGYEKIDTLVTMGCPFDMIRTYFPGYFDDRVARRTTNPVPYWVNIYSPHDVLGSNFRNDKRSGEPDIGLDVVTGAGAGVDATPAANAVFHAGRSARRPSFLSWIYLYGMKTHGMYWTKDRASEDALMVLPRDAQSWQARILEGAVAPPT